MGHVELYLYGKSFVHYNVFANACAVVFCFDSNFIIVACIDKLIAFDNGTCVYKRSLYTVAENMLYFCVLR